MILTTNDKDCTVDDNIITEKTKLNFSHGWCNFDLLIIFLMDFSVLRNPLVHPFHVEDDLAGEFDVLVDC